MSTCHNVTYDYWLEALRARCVEVTRAGGNSTPLEMKKRTMRSLAARTIMHAMAAIGLAAVAALGTASSAVADNSSDFNRAYSLGLQGYAYGEPLLNMQS